MEIDKSVALLTGTRIQLQLGPFGVRGGIFGTHPFPGDKEIFNLFIIKIFRVHLAAPARQNRKHIFDREKNYIFEI